MANKGKATAFLNVNRPVEFPLDLKGILPQLTRTLDLMNEADAHLAIAKEQIKYAQFWFLKTTQLDEIAFNHLFAGKIDEAISIWSKQDNTSSLQNKMICHLIKGALSGAISIAQQLYSKFGDTYIDRVDSSCTLKMTAVELRNLFIDSLGESVGFVNLLSAATDKDWKSYISSQTIGPLIAKISAEVEKTKKVDHKDPNARINAARKLIASTEEAFSQLKSLLPSSDPQFQMIADKLGLEILQCGIDYFIGLEDKDDDAPFTAMKMLKHARTIVVGSIAVKRCDDQIRELQKFIDSLPPKEVMAEYRAIKAELDKFVRLSDKITYAVTLLKNTKPHLQKIKSKLGAENSYYLKLSTQIVGNALHNVVEEVNAVQNDPQIALRMQLGLGLDSSSRSRIKDVLREAWKATTIMDGFDLEPGFKSHYNENRSILKSMCKQLGISTFVPPTPPPTPRPSPSERNSNSSNDSSSSSDNNGCIIALVIMVVIGIIGAMINGGKGFLIGLFLGAVIGGFINDVID